VAEWPAVIEHHLSLGAHLLLWVFPLTVVVSTVVFHFWWTNDRDRP
jgi:hypothetical protein